MTPGPDGNIWFTEFRGNRIGRMSPQGRLLDEFPIPTPNSGAEGIAVGPDGNVWFTENRANKIGRITPSGTITEFPVPTPNSNPNGIVAGADGNMWVALAGSNRIGRITMSGRITSFPVPTPASQPGITAVGPDGNVWFAEYSGNRIGRITPSGAITEFVLPNPNSAPHELVTGPDGAIWFTEFGGNRIGRITTAGAITEFAVPTANSRPEGIRVGSDQNIWFTEFGGNKIGRLVVEPEPVPPPVFAQAIDIAPVGGVVTVQVAGTAKPVPLTAPDQLQVGSTIDTRAGRVRITIADANGRLWSATFYEGVFKITQLAADGGVAQLSLAGGSFKRCGRAARSGAETSAKKKSSKSVRHLWASGDGPFRTKGRFASATIRGTTWNTDDRCDGTLVKVTVGAVTVRDLVRKKSLVVRARRQYLAKAR
jgi:virginiamycin B lyase